MLSGKISIENGAGDETGVNILELAPGESSPVGLSFGFENGRKNHVRVAWGRYLSNNACPGGDHGDTATVTRGTGVDEDSWTFESFAGERACVSEVVNNDWNNPVFRGYYHLPFKFTARIEP